jgi:hypothetical protein
MLLWGIDAVCELKHTKRLIVTVNSLENPLLQCCSVANYCVIQKLITSQTVIYQPSTRSR